eukprot:5980766-Prymnesium_polylepis.1
MAASSRQVVFWCLLQVTSNVSVCSTRGQRIRRRGSERTRCRIATASWSGNSRAVRGADVQAVTPVLPELSCRCTGRTDCAVASCVAAAVGTGGRVVFAPYASAKVGLFDPAASTWNLLDISSFSERDDKYVGAVAALDGSLIVFVPSGESR